MGVHERGVRIMGVRERDVRKMGVHERGVHERGLCCGKDGPYISGQHTVTVVQVCRGGEWLIDPTVWVWFAESGSGSGLRSLGLGLVCGAWVWVWFAESGSGLRGLGLGLGPTVWVRFALFVGRAALVSRVSRAQRLAEWGGAARSGRALRRVLLEYKQTAPRPTNQTQEPQVYFHDGPIRHMLRRAVTASK
eukprot:1175959-Prorocentrum_minimum.AAC.1